MARHHAQNCAAPGPPASQCGASDRSTSLLPFALRCFCLPSQPCTPPTPLREKKKAVVGSEEDRAKREYTLNMSKRALVDLCQQEAAKFLVAQRHELAIPGAVQAISFLKDLHGDGSMELVPPYLQLAEANLGLGRFSQAEEFLSLANWSVLKNPDCSNAIRSQLHRNFGKLYSAQGKLDEALQELAKDIYCSSLEVGPEHVDTSAGYYHMASIFYTQVIRTALACFLTRSSNHHSDSLPSTPPPNHCAARRPARSA